MPGRRKKNFATFRNLAKKGATRFELSYQDADPLAADSETSDNTLDPKSSKEKRLEEQQKYGIYFEDDYNYMQHLRDINELNAIEVIQHVKEEEDDVMSVSAASMAESGLHLPSSSMSSADETGFGLFSVAAASPGPKMDWDPEIAAALGDDFDFDDPENELEDDFMEMANAGEGDSDVELEKEGDEKLADDFKMMQFGKNVVDNEDDDEDDECTDVDSDEAGFDDFDDDDDDNWTDNDDEDLEDDRRNVTRIRKYSSNGHPGNEYLQLLDEKTQALINREYSWDKIGALDGEEMNSQVSVLSKALQQAIDDMQKSDGVVTMKDIVDSKDRIRPVIPESWKFVEEKDYSVEEKVDYRLQPLRSAKKPQYDAESILSTLSRTKNRPTDIVLPEEWNIKKKKKKQQPVEEEPSEAVSYLPGMSLKEIEEEILAERMADAPTTYRPKEESKEERKERKKAVKAYQKERRAEKKMKKLVTQEESHHDKVLTKRKEQKRVKSFQS